MNRASGVAGDRCNRAWVSSWSAWMVMSGDVVAGIGMLVGKFSTVSETRSVPVLEQ